MPHPLACPLPNRLNAWANGDVLPSEAETIDTHLAGCPACQHALAEADDSDPLITSLRPIRFRDQLFDDEPALYGALERAKGFNFESGFPFFDQQVQADDTPAERPAYDDRVAGVESSSPQPSASSESDLSDLLSPPAHADSLGRLGRYEVVSVLGSGGMGIVLKARDLDLNRWVAIKVLKPAFATDSAGRQRFLREARAIGQVRHPNVCPIYEVGEQRGRLYLVLEYVGGGSLAQHLAGVPQSPHQAAELVERLARAIRVAHEQGIVHRDLKPANILLADSRESRDGSREPEKQRPTTSSSGSRPSALDSRPLVTDFGLAKSLADDATQTKTGLILGTPSYMAPEQASGLTKEIGPAADVYALGAILYEMLTGRPPFCGETALDTIQQVLSDDPVAPRRLQPKLPPDLETICLKCLEKEQERRYGSAGELAADLQRFLAGEPIHSRPASLWQRTFKWAKRRPAVATLTASCCLAVMTLFVVGLWYNAQLRSALEQTERQRDRADLNLRKSMDAMHELLIRLSAPEFVNVPETAALRQAITQHSLGVIESFAHNRGQDASSRAEIAHAYGYAAAVHHLQANCAEARKMSALSLEVLGELAREFPHDARYHENLGHAYHRASQESSDLGEHETALREFGLSLASFHRAVELEPNNPSLLNNLAWTLVDCRYPQMQDHTVAVRLAEKATTLAPDRDAPWHTLGVAYYRARKWGQSIAALQRSAELKPRGGDSFDWFFLAMAYWQTGDRESARTWYTRAVEWMELNRSAERTTLKQFRDEAEALIKPNQ
jgi:serine/threonine protein kinase